MSQLVTWYGVGDGSQDDPILLINDSTFDGTKPFNIVIETSTLVPENEITYIRFSTFQTNKLFTLALFYVDKGPLISLNASYASKNTVFNGSNNNKITSGSFVTLNQNNIDYITPTQVFQTQIYNELALNKVIFKYLDGLILADEETIPTEGDVNLLKKVTVNILGGQISLYVSRKDIQDLIDASILEESQAREQAILDFTEEVNNSLQEMSDNISEHKDLIDEKIEEFENRVQDVENDNEQTREQLEEHENDKNNPHEVTKEQIGLGNVENIAPENMPVSDLQVQFINAIKIALENLINSHIGSTSNPHNVTKEQIGLSNVENISPEDMPVSTLQEQAMSLILQIIDEHKLNESNPHNVTKDQIGLGNVENKSVVEIIQSQEASDALSQALSLAGFITEDEAEIRYKKKLSGNAASRPADDLIPGVQYYNETDQQMQTYVDDPYNWLNQKYGHGEQLPMPLDNTSHTYFVIGGGMAAMSSLGSISVGEQVLTSHMLVVSSINGVAHLADMNGEIGEVSNLEIESTGYLKLLRIA